MKKFISKMLIVAMVFSVLCFYPADKKDTAKVYANEEETATEVTTTTAQPTTQEITTQETTTQQHTTVPTTTKAKKKKVVKKYPTKVKNFKISYLKNSSLRVSWSKSKNATYYVVYRATEKKSKMTNYKKYKTLKTLYFDEANLYQGTVYKYKIIAYNKAKTYTTKSKKASFVKAMTNLNPVKTFRATATNRNINLTWSKNSKASKYYLFRASEKNGGFGKFKKIKTLSKKKKSYTDTNVSSGKEYKYRIKVYRKKSGIKKTSRGKVASAMVSLSTPTGLKSSEKATKITLKWNAVANAESYEVFMGNKLIKTTIDTQYTKKNLKKNKKYTFKVRAVREFRGKKYKGAFAVISASTYAPLKVKKKGKGTWVQISIKQQMLYMFVKNKLYLKTPVVTGNVGDRHTSKGTHHVMEKTANRTLNGTYGSQSWNVKVNYWLKFTGDGQGIHDSTWRSAYGGNIYKTDGSHGCVNTPLGPMRRVFKKAYVGMPVIVY